MSVNSQLNKKRNAKQSLVNCDLRRKAILRSAKTLQSRVSEGDKNGFNLIRYITFHARSLYGHENALQKRFAFVVMVQNSIMNLQFAITHYEQQY